MAFLGKMITFFEIKKRGPGIRLGITYNSLQYQPSKALLFELHVS